VRTLLFLTKTTSFIALLDMIERDMTDLEGEPLTYTKATEMLRRQGHALASIDEHHLSAITKILANNTALATNFTPGVFHGDMLVCTAIDRPEDAPWPAPWRPHVDGNVEFYQIKGGHDRLMQPGPLAEIGSILAANSTKSLAEILIRPGG
jgi:thioesterase domain-containing protein